jgi:hypothetical protein
MRRPPSAILPLFALLALAGAAPAQADDKPTANFDGLWETSFGRLRLAQTGTAIEGTYSYGGGSVLKGEVEKDRLTFRYVESEAAGEGWFELAPSGKKFHGKWRAAGSEAWQEWDGTRIEPVPGRVWLVVLEANWEGSLAEQEYSFGHMLRAFFARSEKVQVRHRWVTDAASLRRWCQELTYLAEPAVLLFAMHGSEAGVNTGRQTVGAKELAAHLKGARTLKLIHFSSCQIMKGSAGGELAKGLGGRVPVSGYRTTVDWAGSAVIEFTYLDLILLRGYKPAAAAEQVLKLLPFAGDKGVPGAAIPAAGFRLLTGNEEKGE